MRATVSCTAEFSGASAGVLPGALLCAVQGTTASGGTDANAPVKIGSVFRATPGTFTDGQRADSQADTRGNLKVTLLARNTDTELGTAASPLNVMFGADPLGLSSRTLDGQSTAFVEDRQTRRILEQILVTLQDMRSQDQINLSSGLAIGPTDAR